MHGENKIKTLADLNAKAWYRAVKVVYVLFFSITIAVLLWFAVGMGETEAFYFIGFLVLIAFVLQRAFYYVALGRMNPKKDTKKPDGSQSGG